MTYENNNASHNILTDNNAKDAYNKLPIYNERLGNANTVIVESVNDNNKREFAITHGDTDAGISQDLERIVNTKGNPTVEAHHLNEVPARYDDILSDQEWGQLPDRLKAVSYDGSYQVSDFTWNKDTRTVTLRTTGENITPTMNDLECWGELGEGWAQLIFPNMKKAGYTYHIVQKNLNILEYVPTFYPTGVKDLVTHPKSSSDYQIMLSACGFPNTVTIDVEETSPEGVTTDFHIKVFSSVTYKTPPAYKPGTVDETVVIDGVKDWSDYVTKPKTEDEPDSED